MEKLGTIILMCFFLLEVRVCYYCLYTFVSNSVYFQYVLMENYLFLNLTRKNVTVRKRYRYEFFSLVLCR